MSDRRRIGAYLLAADPTWIRSSLARYYDHLDVLVVSASATGLGWTGHPIQAEACVEIIKSMDTRNIVRVVRGQWVDSASPGRADTAQRQSALAEMAGQADWVLQIDSDEVLPSLPALHAVLDRAETMGLSAIEWPMCVMYRQLRNGNYLHVTTNSGGAHYEYPGPIAVRPDVALIDCRRARGRYLRPVVVGDEESLQITQSPAPEEIRLTLLTSADAILHNSWARTPGSVRRKMLSWGHNQGLRSRIYFYRTWLPTPLRWKRMHDFHPLYPALWPRLAIYPGDVTALLDPAER